MHAGLARIIQEIYSECPLMSAVSVLFSRSLLLMAHFWKEGKPEPVIAKISQETLAEMIGTTCSRSVFS